MSGYDVVIPVRPGERNEDLRFSLRSLDKFGFNIRKVWLVGYRPSWVRNVEILPTSQHLDKWLNTRKNIESACRCKEITDDFILMNDDFILTQRTSDWRHFNGYHRGTLFEKECFYSRFPDGNVWREGFHFNRQILILAGYGKGEFEPLNYEVHFPVVLNREKRLTLFDRPEFRKYKNESDPLLFQRSIYFNLYPHEFQRQISDGKIFTDVKNFDYFRQHEVISVADNVIGDRDKAPILHQWLDENLSEKSCFEA